MFAIFRIVPLVIIAAIVAIVVALARGTRRFGGGRRGRVNSDQQGSGRTYANTTRSNYHGPSDDPVEVPIIEVNDVKED
ncbi:MAG: hypothetical protein IKE61_04715 [Coriobacteriales bacterium]|nr:hypothetical protein [Coriobacteriales bacterium]